MGRSGQLPADLHFRTQCGSLFSPLGSGTSSDVCPSVGSLLIHPPTRSLGRPLSHPVTARLSSLAELYCLAQSQARSRGSGNFADFSPSFPFVALEVLTPRASERTVFEHRDFEEVTKLK